MGRSIGQCAQDEYVGEIRHPRQLH